MCSTLSCHGLEQTLSDSLRNVLKKLRKIKIFYTGFKKIFIEKCIYRKLEFGLETLLESLSKRNRSKLVTTATIHIKLMKKRLPLLGLEQSKKK